MLSEARWILDPGRYTLVKSMVTGFTFYIIFEILGYVIITNNDSDKENKPKPLLQVITS